MKKRRRIGKSKKNNQNQNFQKRKSTQGVQLNAEESKRKNSDLLVISIKIFTRERRKRLNNGCKINYLH